MTSTVLEQRPAAPYQLWVSPDRTLLVRRWESGTVEVCRRDDASGIWGPPVVLNEERFS